MDHPISISNSTASIPTLDTTDPTMQFMPQDPTSPTMAIATSADTTGPTTLSIIIFQPSSSTPTITNTTTSTTLLHELKRKHDYGEPSHCHHQRTLPPLVLAIPTTLLHPGNPHNPYTTNAALKYALEYNNSPNSTYAVTAELKYGNPTPITTIHVASAALEYDNSTPTSTAFLTLEYDNSPLAYEEPHSPHPDCHLPFKYGNPTLKYGNSPLDYGEPLPPTPSLLQLQNAATLLHPGNPNFSTTTCTTTSDYNITHWPTPAGHYTTTTEWSKVHHCLDYLDLAFTYHNWLENHKHRSDWLKLRTTILTMGLFASQAQLQSLPNLPCLTWLQFLEDWFLSVLDAEITQLDKAESAASKSQSGFGSTLKL